MAIVRRASICRRSGDRKRCTQKVGGCARFQGYDGRIPKSVSYLPSRRFRRVKLNPAIVHRVSVISRIPRFGIVAALAGAMAVPAFSQAPEGRQRATGEAPTAKEEQSVPIPPETN